MTSRHAPVDSDWDRQLADAFGMMIGRPLHEFDPDAVYAAGVGGNLINEVEFDHDPAWVRPQALSGAEPVCWDASLFDDSVRTPVFDAAGSIFGIPADRDSPALPEPFASAVAAACFSDGLIRGADLAPLLVEHGVDLAEHPGRWVVHFARLRSDGTLLDAFRAALDTGRTPEDLVPFEVAPEEGWEEDLATVAHPGLRAHVSYFLTDGEVGLMPMFDDARAFGLDDYACEAVMGWEDGFGQIDLSIIRLSPEVAGPRT
ncbi:hypothetical protein [Kitasatospora sp. CB01950]|uniref:hypothetical protein n=1 Tax=Kitasatospora sp. CB01950 TaxID=1703930 RepID=UPI00093CC8F4|nr:hypothetical protein [Kitasatospora sp. CB01950]OKJ13597.1 hypothetical protein AMK19_09055 [Kitasatospora sp. CB01950]